MKMNPTNVSSRLTYLAEEIANAQASTAALLLSPSNLIDPVLDEAITRIVAIDQKLIKWELDLPDNWYPKPVAYLSRSDLAKFVAYGDHIDIYPDLWVANSYNTFRLLGILMQLLICESLRRYSTPWPASVSHGPFSYVSTTQRLVDEVCASVPFFLGNKYAISKFQDVELPCPRDVSVSVGYRQTALRLGGWFLFAPLSVCSHIPFVPDRQKAWIHSQTERLNKFHGMRSSYQGHFPGWRLMFPGKQLWGSHFVKIMCG